MLHLLAQATQDFTYSTAGSSDTSINSGLIIGLVVAFIVLYVISGFLMGKIFEKAGRPFWIGFVPVYNQWVLFEISGKPGWWALTSLTGGIPIVGWITTIIYLVLFILAMLELAKRFEKSTLFAVFGLIIFSLVGMAMLAFDKSVYKAAPGAAAEPPYPSAPSGPQNPTAPNAS